MMKSIMNIIQQAPKHSKIMKNVLAARAIQTANEFIHDFWTGNMEDYAQAVLFKNRILTIACLNSEAANNLKMQEKRLITAINSTCGQNFAAQIKLLL